METSREDVGIQIRSAFLSKGIQQRFSLLILILFSALIIFLETIQSKPLNVVRSFIKDVIYRGNTIVSYPIKVASNLTNFLESHINLYDDYKELIEENNKLKNDKSETEYLEMENSQLRRLIDEQVKSSSDLVSARVLIDKQSPYLNSFVINIGSNKNIKNGMAVLDGKNFIGRIVDVNYFSSRILLITDLNSKIPVISEPTGSHAILSGHGESEPTLEYLSENHNINDGDKVYTSGKEGIFKPGLAIGGTKLEDDQIKVKLFSDLNQITFVNISLREKRKK